MSVVRFNHAFKNQFNQKAFSQFPHVGLTSIPIYLRKYVRALYIEKSNIILGVNSRAGT